MTHPNPYAQQILDKGRDLPAAAAPRRVFPLTIGLRTYYSEEHYQEALADFLNGY
jgi:hypothetical protein